MITGILTLHLLMEIIRKNILRKDRNALSTGMASLVLIMFGLYKGGAGRLHEIKYLLQQTFNTFYSL